MTKITEKIIVALDVPSKDAALHLVEQLRHQISFFKIGLQLYTAEGPEIVRAIRATGALRLGNLGVAAGIDGLVASPFEARFLRSELGDKIKIVVPGVRPSWAEPGDQKRFMTPREAIEAGADYLVIGRPITAHENPREAVEKILTELGS
jgi:orotidine-5'-phosphate decarboxylase